MPGLCGDGATIVAAPPGDRRPDQDVEERGVADAGVLPDLRELGVRREARQRVDLVDDRAVAEEEVDPEQSDATQRVECPYRLVSEFVGNLGIELGGDVEAASFAAVFRVVVEELV